MKRLITLICISLLFISCDNTIKFLDIPVDGNKEQVTKKLEDKGFKYDSKSDNFSGTFNGKSARLYVVTNNGKVNRVCVIFNSISEEDELREYYNNLINQFTTNGKYIAAVEPASIPKKESIFWEMCMHDKEYETAFYPKNILTKKEIKALKNNIPIDSASGAVWFKIIKLEYSYFLVLYYDNLNNMPNGEDL